jgi:carbamoyltransferase
MEENTLATARGLHAGFVANRTSVEAIVLSGGVALNCPANTRVARETPFSRVRVAPAVDDSGLPLGAAQAVAHDLLDIPRLPVDPDSTALAYLGRAYGSREIERAIAEAGEAIRVVETDDPADAAAADLAADQVIAWFEGRSEVGPRALGHRSILADVRRPENWKRVNRLKRCEEWRPFAPAVLKEKAADWFDGPLPSAHMLFTAQVRGTALPAITHVDGSARVQTVGSECGRFRKVLEAFDARTGVPVVMNTSFNGPGEPIVETPEQAVAFLTSSAIDAVYVDGRKLVRKETE